MHLLALLQSALVPGTHKQATAPRLHHHAPRLTIELQLCAKVRRHEQQANNNFGCNFVLRASREAIASMHARTH
jgi:hypothetical protein